MSEFDSPELANSKFLKGMAKKKKTFKAKLELLNIPETINLKNIFNRLQHNFEQEAPKSFYGFDYSYKTDTDDEK